MTQSEPTSLEWNAVTAGQALKDLDDAAGRIRAHQEQHPTCPVACQILLALPEPLTTEPNHTQ